MSKKVKTNPLILPFFSQIMFHYNTNRIKYQRRLENTPLDVLYSNTLVLLQVIKLTNALVVYVRLLVNMLF